MSLVGFLIVFFYSESLWARSLKAAADKLAADTTRIGFGLAVFGIVLASIYFMLGKQDASTKMTQALMGVVVLTLSTSIVGFVKGIA